MFRLAAAALALVLMASAAVGAPSLAEARRVALDAAEIRVDFPQLFGGGRIDMEAKPKSAGHEFSGSSGQFQVPFAAYDLTDGRIVFTPARGYMPTVDGLKAEGVSLRRHAVRFKYSFR